MSSRIFDIENWEQGNIYGMWDIIKYPETTPKPRDVYYYCVVPHTASSSFDATKWAGRGIWNNAYYKPKFLWTPSYGSNMNLEPKVKSIKFGEGYEQRLPDGINNSLLKFNLNFNGRPLNEATAIIHFLKARGGFESFIYNTYAPFTKLKLYKCPNYNVDFVFFNNYNISATFEEVVN